MANVSGVILIALASEQLLLTATRKLHDCYYFSCDPSPLSSQRSTTKTINNIKLIPINFGAMSRLCVKLKLREKKSVWEAFCIEQDSVPIKKNAPFNDSFSESASTRTRAQSKYC